MKLTFEQLQRGQLDGPLHFILLELNSSLRVVCEQALSECDSGILATLETSAELESLILEKLSHQGFSIDAASTASRVITHHDSKFVMDVTSLSQEERDTITAVVQQIFDEYCV